MNPSSCTPCPCLPMATFVQQLSVYHGAWGLPCKSQVLYSQSSAQTFATCIYLWLQEPCRAPRAYLWHTNQSLTAEPEYLPHFHVLVLLTNISPVSLVKSLPVREGENPHLPILVVTKQTPFQNGFLQTTKLCAFQLINHIRKQHAVSHRA